MLLEERLTLFDHLEVSHLDSSSIQEPWKNRNSINRTEHKQVEVSREHFNKLHRVPEDESDWLWGWIRASVNMNLIGWEDL